MEETIEYKGYEIKIDNDSEDSFNPRTEYDNLGEMVCFHSRYDLGDKHDFSDSEEIVEYIKLGNVIALPLYLYDHSGITMNTTGFQCNWDSGVVGFIYVTKEKLRKEYGWKRITKDREKKVVGYLRNEVETYDFYLTGAVYGYNIEKDGEEIDESCWGFLGYDHRKSGLLEYAENAVDCHKKDIEKIKKNEGEQQELKLESV